MKYVTILLVTLSVLLLSACQFGVDEGDDVVTLYTERHYDVDQELYDRFTELTGITVNVVRDGADQLLTRLKNEGEDSPADLLIIADVGRFHQAKSEDLLQSVTSDVLTENIPEAYRDDEGHWFGLTRRARVIVYHPDRVDVNELSTYEDLADPKWQGRIIIRTSANIYNQSLMASFIEIMGEDAARSWAEGLVANFARDPQGNDTDQAKDVAAGVADLAIMNTYYIGRMLNSDDANLVAVGETLRVFFPNQDTTGTHVNISAAGVVKHAPNKDNAVRLLEFLSSVEAQTVYAGANFEYPMHPDVDMHPILASWGTFKAQDIPLTTLGRHSARATIIMNEAGWK